MEKFTFSLMEIPPLPPAAGEAVQPGLAGPVAGLSDDCVLVAGGANFPDGPPWKGGIKQYHDEIYLLQKSAGGTSKWHQPAALLPCTIAYPACVSTPSGIVAIGGENETGLLGTVFLISVRDGNIGIKNLPGLPVPVSSGGAAVIGSMVYFAGGLDNHGASAGFYCLDILTPQNGWKRLADLPVPLSHAVVVSQKDKSGECVYVIGGRNKTGLLSTFQSSIWKYVPAKNTWDHEGDVLVNGQPVVLSAGMGIAAGKCSIVLFGGDRGIVFNKIEQINADIEKAAEAEKKALMEQKDSMLTNHPGFLRDILVYNTLKKTWMEAGEIPVETPVTTTAFYLGGVVVIPSGEVRPGVRTPRVLGIETGISE